MGSIPGSGRSQEVEVKEEVNLVNGKTVEERIEEAYDKLHSTGSAQHIRDNFLDLEIIYTDDGSEDIYDDGDNIYPFHYQYSEEADKTFNLCNVERTVFICDGKLDRMITDEDMDSGRCIVTPIYRPIVSGSNFGSSY